MSTDTNPAPAPAVTLAILARDEEGSLGAAIDSARRCAAAVVVLDTGSADSTRELAWSLGARVVEADWEDDFASSRNLLLACCATDWVLMLDADERLTSGGDALPALVANPSAHAFNALVESASGGGRLERALVPRLFRRTAETAFEGRVHERLTRLVPPLPSPLRIVHDGFLPARRGAKLKRNLALLDLALSERPADPYLLWQRGRDLALSDRAGEVERALEAMAAALARIDSTELSRLEFAPEAASDWYEDLARRGQARRAVPLATRVLLAHPNRPLARYVHIRALAAAGRHHDAALAIQSLLAPRSWRIASPDEGDVLTRHAPELLDRLTPAAAIA